MGLERLDIRDLRRIFATETCNRILECLNIKLRSLVEYYLRYSNIVFRFLFIYVSL